MLSTSSPLTNSPLWDATEIDVAVAFNRDAFRHKLAILERKNDFRITHRIVQRFELRLELGPFGQFPHCREFVHLGDTEIDAVVQQPSKILE